MNGVPEVPVDLVPVRALNQVSYCPRLYFLEYVEAVMPTNEYVEDGLFQHRRINDPTLENRPRKEGEVIKTRSVSLGSARLGITGKLDVLEERADATIPVETKRSKAPTDDLGEPTAWPNDAIQLCAQAMLMEDAWGISVERGVLYYAGSKTRVDVAIDESLRRSTTDAIDLIRELSARDTPPEPLPAMLRHRCFGCSLAPICLPEEILHGLGHPAAAPPPEVATPPVSAGVRLTRVIPSCDERAVLYVQEPGTHIGRRSEHLILNCKGVETGRIPLASIRQMVVFGNVQVSTQAIQTLAEHEIPVSYLTGHGKFIASVMPAPPKNVALRSHQYRAFSDPETALGLARAVVAAKISNQRTLLMRSLRLQPRDEPSAGSAAASEATSPPARGSDEPAARDMAELLRRLPRAADQGALLGLEGQAASLYFGEFGRMIKARPPCGSFDFQSRNRRPPRDPVNALLSFAYALLCKDCFAAACTVGFDPYQGFYHAGRHGKPSLALDLMEEFRAVIADSVVLGLVNNGMLSKRDFLIYRDACQLSDVGREIFFKAYEQRKATEVMHPVFGYRMTYGRMLEVQARMLAAFVRGDLPAYTGFTVR
ncbi:CRISPR-associated endonuclease Cas4g/Cas1g [Aquisphaera insulae]|uniref:CRISPR-associated endonuclease Cas4g/Cas1g n=1 Tax=Aquisphaera insulae TaxID=2712864 RepID=UPI0013EA7A0A|nr:CRISPR-associated endonuclease Cas1 [Aquisphaera insulae]